MKLIKLTKDFYDTQKGELVPIPVFINFDLVENFYEADGETCVSFLYSVPTYVKESVEDIVRKLEDRCI